MNSVLDVIDASHASYKRRRDRLRGVFARHQEHAEPGRGAVEARRRRPEGRQEGRLPDDERLPVFDENANAEVVATTYASQQTADRRAARAGSSGEAGKCYRLYTEEAFRTILPAKHEPASRRSELAAAMLQLKAVGVSNVLDFDWPSPPTELLICAAFEELLALRAIDDQGELTKPDGARLALAPCGPRTARFLLASLEAGCSEEALDVACVLATKRTLRRTDRRVKEEQKRLFRDEIVDLDGDHATYVKALRAFRESPHPEQFCSCLLYTSPSPRDRG